MGLLRWGQVETDEQIAAKIPPNEWPIMLKNTSLSLGRGVFRVKNKEKLFAILAESRAQSCPERAKCSTSCSSETRHIENEDKYLAPQAR